MDCFCNVRSCHRKKNLRQLTQSENKSYSTIRYVQLNLYCLSRRAILFQGLQQQLKQLLKTECSCMKNTLLLLTEHEYKCIPTFSTAAVLLISKMTYSSYISHHFKALIHTERLRSTQEVITSAGCLFL